MTKVSIIVHFYEGERFINNLKQLYQSIAIEANKKGIKLEVIIVNDSPWIQLSTTSFRNNNLYELKIITNDQNYGIHLSRINGIKHSTGEYIIMLDQDDIIEANTLYSQVQLAQKNNADCIISNGIMKGKNENKIIINTNGKKYWCCRNLPYLISNNLLSSPGQCLIKKKSIPEFWMENILKTNCSDDVYLWILLFRKQNKIIYNDKILYTHVYTGTNCSLDKLNGIESDLKVNSLLRESNQISPFLLYLHKRKCFYNKKRLQSKLIAGLIYIDYYLIMILFKTIMYLTNLTYDTNYKG